MQTIEPPSQHSIDNQVKRELEALDRGVTRYRRLCEDAISRGDGASLKPAERLQAAWFKDLLREVRAEVRRCEKQDEQQRAYADYSPHRVHYGQAFQMLSPEKMAVITMHEVLSACMLEPFGPEFRIVAERIGKCVNAELNLPAIVKDPPAWKALQKKDRRCRKVDPVMKISRKFKPELVFTRATTIRLGTVLLFLLTGVAMVPDRTGKAVAALIKSKGHYSRKNRTAPRLVMHDAVYDLIGDGHAMRQHLRPRYTAMTVPPIPRTSMREGGYYRLDTQLVKKASRYAEKIDAADMPIVYKGVNALSATPWVISPVLDVVNALWDSGGGYANIPPVRDKDKPPRPNVFDNEEDEKKWNAEAVLIRRENIKLQSERMNFHMTLQQANELRHAKAIYFPHQLDFRGRAYPTPLFLQHQGSDLCRGLLMFARPVPCSPDNRWLHIHAANCCGVDKVPFDQRIGWVKDSWEALKGWATAPLENTGWMLQKKPFQALLAAMALHNPEVAKRIPVQMDGSCNGLQHYAALGRDEEGAASVNLVPGDAPSDVYSKVMRHVAHQVTIDAGQGMQSVHKESGHVFRVASLEGLITRDIVKQTVMTTVYGVTSIGARDQIYNQLKKAGVPKADLFLASVYVANVTMKAMGNVCQGAARIMAWLKQCAVNICKTKKLVTWTTPLGLPVEQGYFSWKTRIIHTLVQQLTLPIDESKHPASPRLQINGFAPNFIHSIDSSHMLMVAAACSDIGIDFAGVHDSYWCHAGNSETLSHELRRQFVTLHSMPILDVLMAELRAQYPEVTIPNIPEPGQFRLEQVVDSPYFFG